MNAPQPPRCALSSVLPSGNGLSDEERAAAARRQLWLEHGIPAFREGDTRHLAWQIIEQEAIRLYGRRR